MIEVRHLYKRFGNLWAIRDLNFSIKKGTFYCLLGPNGAGKSTTLKILTGLIKPTRGEVFILGYNLEKNFQKIKEKIGFIPDTPFLYENLTSVEFLEFIGSIFGVERKKMEETLNYYFDIFNLKGYEDVLIKELSHGMRQKIVYISNFIHQPSIFFVDEPLVGLDPYSIHLIKKLLKEETQKGNVVFMCTHLIPIAEELADIIGIIYEGKLLAEDSPEELKKKFSVDNLEEIFLGLANSKRGI